MNILGLCLSPGKGGLELYAHKAISALHDAGHTCCFAFAPDSFLGGQDWTVPVIELQPSFRHLPWLTAHRLARYLDDHQVDIIHMHWNKDLPLAALAKALSRRKPKLVYTRHMEITRSKKDRYHRLLYRRVDKLLVISEFVLTQAIRYLPLRAEQVSLLYLGVMAPSPVSAQECQELLPGQGSGEMPFVIGMIGRIEPYKGQHVLIDALATLKQQHISPLVVMAGAVMDQSYFDTLKEQIYRQDLKDNVHYIGISREPGKLMSCCDVVVLTTYRETFGLVLIEAMRAGTAVLGTNAGGVPEIIQHNETGMLYEPGDAQQLAACLAELYRDPAKREELAKSGKTYADGMFDDQQHVQNLEKILSSLCTDKL